MMRRTLLLAALLASPLALAQSYKWVDSNGRTHYTDQPPGGGKSTTTIKAAPAPAQGPNARSAVAEQEQAFRKRKADAEKQAAKAAKSEEAAAERARDCDLANRQLGTLRSGERVTKRDASGERAFLDDNEIAAERERTKQFLRTNCG